MKVKIEVIDGHKYANLGNGDFPEALIVCLTARYAGCKTVKSDGDILFYNGAADSENVEIYQCMVDEMLSWCK